MASEEGSSSKESGALHESSEQQTEVTPTAIQTTLNYSTKNQSTTGWWLNQSIWKNMLVKLDHETPNRGENSKKYLKPPPRQQVNGVKPFQ